MKHHNVEQGSNEWHDIRCGLLTASNFSKIITSTGKPSTQKKTYAYELVADKVAKKPIDIIKSNEWMERGKEIEAEAVDNFVFLKSTEVAECGIFVNNNVGASPDRLIGEDGLLEVKCPKGSTQIKYLEQGKVPSEYYAQIQGQLWVTEREYCEFFSFHPDLPYLSVKCGRDEDFIKKLSEEAIDFLMLVDKIYKKVTETAKF